MKKWRIAAKILLSFGVLLALYVIFTLVSTAFTRSALQALNETADSQEAAVILRRSLTASYLFVAVSFTAAAAIGLWLSRHLSRPLGFLSGAISGIAKTGSIFLDDAAYKQTKTLNKRGDEIGHISRSVGDMLAMFRHKIKSLNAIAGGDLTARVELCSPKDSVGTALAGMTESLNRMFAGILSSAGQVSAGSAELAAGSAELAESSGAQSEAIERLRDRIAAIAEQTGRNARMARESSSLSGSIKQLAQKGGTQMDDMIGAVRQINESSGAIGRVIKVIDDIAFQTNILALNAAVEAARAGQHGKGFAVVAQEVRALAAKSQAAVEETEALIADSIRRARQGAKIAGDTAASLQEIVDGIHQSTQLAGEIAGSSDEQAEAIARINQNVDEVNHAMRRNSETAARSAGVSQEVSGHSELLQERLARFKIEVQPIIDKISENHN